MDALRVYSQENVMCNVAGNIIDQLAPDGIKANYNVPLSSYVNGSDGSGTVVKTANRSGSIEITVLQSSLANDLFMSLYTAFALSDTGGFFPIYIKDNNGKTLITGVSCWIENVPEITLGDSLSMRTWVFQTSRLSLVCGSSYLAGGTSAA